jgi:hypothetical protein
MSANSTPIFTLTPNIGHAQVSVANTGRDGSGAVVNVLTGAVNGTRVEYVRVVAVGTVTTGVVRLFVNSGSVAFLWKEILVTATTPSTSVEVFNAEYVPTKPLVLPSGWVLEASTHNAETFNVFAHAGDY